MKVSQNFAALIIILSRAKEVDQYVYFHALNVLIKFALDSIGEQSTCSCNLKLTCATLNHYLFNQDAKTLKY